MLGGGGYQVLAQDGTFVLLRPSDRAFLTLPSNGDVSFRLVQSTLLVRGDSGFSRAEAVNPRLTVNFGAQTFDTALALRGESLNDAVRGSGAITADGRFVVDTRRSNADIRGGLSNSGQEAGYVFVRGGQNGSNASIGVTRWER